MVPFNEIFAVYFIYKYKTKPAENMSNIMETKHALSRNVWFSFRVLTERKRNLALKELVHDKVENLE